MLITVRAARGCPSRSRLALPSSMPGSRSGPARGTLSASSNRQGMIAQQTVCAIPPRDGVPLVLCGSRSSAEQRRPTPGGAAGPNRVVAATLRRRRVVNTRASERCETRRWCGRQAERPDSCFAASVWLQVQRGAQAPAVVPCRGERRRLQVVGHRSGTRPSHGCARPRPPTPSEVAHNGRPKLAALQQRRPVASLLHLAREVVGDGALRDCGCEALDHQVRSLRPAQVA